MYPMMLFRNKRKALPSIATGRVPLDFKAIQPYFKAITNWVNTMPSSCPNLQGPAWCMVYECL